MTGRRASNALQPPRDSCRVQKQNCEKHEELEANLKREYEQSRGTAGLRWDKAKSAPRDAWNRVEKILPGDVDGDGR
jgi:hypothetical protein